jgi:fructose-1,6-bisphosphatase I
MKSFNHFLRERDVSNEVRSLLYHLARSVKYINFSIRAGNTGKAGSENTFGEEQVAMDVLADNIIANELQYSELASVIASEEKSKPEYFEAPRGNYFVAYDPLDGSSLVDSNLAIGSIFGIWENGDNLFKKGLKAGENMVAACYAVYGPRVTFTIAIKDKGTHEFELNDVGEFILTREDIKISSNSKYFAPGNLRCCIENPKYKDWLDTCIDEKKTLRYSGGMVPDLHHILSKGNGMFAYPRDNKHLDGKLRLLFEGAPFAMVFEEAGGIAFEQEGNRILETKVTDVHQKTPVFIGSSNDVVKVVQFLN